MRSRGCNCICCTLGKISHASNHHVTHTHTLTRTQTPSDLHNRIVLVNERKHSRSLHSTDTAHKDILNSRWSRTFFLRSLSENCSFFFGMGEACRMNIKIKWPNKVLRVLGIDNTSKFPHSAPLQHACAGLSWARGSMTGMQTLGLGTYHRLFPSRKYQMKMTEKQFELRMYQE